MTKYSFKEGKIKGEFCAGRLKAIKGYIDSSTAVTIIGMPGVGVSFFLRYLASLDIAHFIFVDSYALSTLSRKEYIRWLLKELGEDTLLEDEQEIFERCKKRLSLLVKESDKKIVIIFNRFDQLKEEFDKQFLANIRALKYINSEKIVMIFTANKPLYEIAPEAIIGTNLHFYSEVFYFGTYNKADLQKLISVNFPEVDLRDRKIDELIELSGGHNQLFMIALNSENKNLVTDRFVSLQLLEIYDFLSYPRKKMVQKIAQGKNPGEVDEFLLSTAIVQKVDNGYQLFTTLLSEYVKIHIPNKIPAKERQLFKLLRSRKGQIVSKDELFAAIWGDDPDLASDWALNALIYRLRQNKTFKSQGFTIESHKKQGYSLV